MYAICTTSVSNAKQFIPSCDSPIWTESKWYPPRTVWPWLYSVNAMASLLLSLQPHRRGGGCGFDASGRVSTNAGGCSWNVSLMTGIAGTTVSKFIPTISLATRNLKIMDRICMNIHISWTFVRLFYGPPSFITTVRFCILCVWDFVSKISFILKNISHIAMVFSKELQSYIHLSMF